MKRRDEKRIEGKKRTQKKDRGQISSERTLQTNQKVLSNSVFLIWRWIVK